MAEQLHRQQDGCVFRMSRGLTIVVPAFDRPRLLRDTLDSVIKLVVPANTDVEVLVIASPARPDIAGVVQDMSGGPIPVRFIPEKKPGLSHARNQGLELASFDHVAFFDDDVQVSTTWIAGYFEAVEKFAADCVVGPVFPLFEGPVPSFISDEVLNSICSPYSRRGSGIIPLPTAVAHEVPGCNFGFLKSVGLGVGGFDIRLGTAPNVNVGGEDFDFGARLVQAGKRVVYHPACSIRHVISTAKLTKQWFRRRAYGSLMPRRLADIERGHRVFSALAARTATKAAWLLVTACALRLIRKPARSFERELQARALLGYVAAPFVARRRAAA